MLHFWRDYSTAWVEFMGVSGGNWGWVSQAHDTPGLYTPFDFFKRWESRELGRVSVRASWELAQCNALFRYRDQEGF